MLFSQYEWGRWGQQDTILIWTVFFIATYEVQENNLLNYCGSTYTY